MAKFTYQLALGWPYDHDFLKKELTKYANREGLTLVQCETDKEDRNETFTLEGDSQKINILEILSGSEESLMAELVGA